MRILLVEDEADMRGIIKKQLQNEGYGVDDCVDGEDALYFAQSAEYDLIILDIMLPKIDGLTVLSRLRKRKDTTPVLLLTARSDVDDRVTGLDLGADDYLTKPFYFEELLARIRVLTRRKATEDGSNTLTVGDLVLDRNKRTVFRAGQEVKLTQKEYSVLEYMMNNKGRVLSREQIEAHVWSYDCISGSNLIDVYIRCLRKKIDANFDIKLIQTVRGAGYCIRESE